MLGECSEKDAAVQHTFDITLNLDAVLGNPCGKERKGKEIASFLTKENPPYTPVAATSLLHVLH